MNNKAMKKEPKNNLQINLVIDGKKVTKIMSESMDKELRARGIS
jgi:hypothetical protein